VAERIFVVKVSPTVADDGSTIDVLFSSVPWTTKPTDTPANTPVLGLLNNPGTLRRALFANARVTGAIVPSFGTIELKNEVTTVGGAGSLDDWLGYGLAGSKVEVHWGYITDTYPSAWTPIYVAYCDSFVANVDTLQIRLRDQLKLLDQPIITEGFAGTGGIEGGGAVPKRKQFVSQDPGLIEPILVDAVKQIYFVQSTGTYAHSSWSLTPSAEVNAFDVFDKGVKISRSTSIYATSADLLATAPAAGYVKYWFGSDSTTLPGYKNGPVYFRLGSPPADAIRCYPIGTPNDADSARYGSAYGSFTAQILALRAGVDSVNVDRTGLALTVGPQLVDDDRTYADTLSDSALALQGWFGFTRLGVFRSGYLLDPESTDYYYGVEPSVIGGYVAPADSVSVYTFKDAQLKNLRREPVPGMEVPVWSVAAKAGDAWPVQTKDSAATATLKDYLSRQVWSAFSGVSSSTKLANPGADHMDVTMHGRYFQSSLDVRIWLERFFALYGGRRSFYSFTTGLTDELLALDLHDCVTLQTPRFGLSAGKKFRIAAITMDCKGPNPSITFVLWGGTGGKYTGGSTTPGTSGDPPVDPTLARDLIAPITGTMYGSVSVSAAAAASSALLGDFTGTMSGTVVTPTPTTSVAYAINTTAGDTLAIPSHAAGDLILIIARANSATIPGLITGFTTVDSLLPTFGNGFRIMYAVDAANTITSVTSVNASVVICHIYRGATTIGAHQLSAETNTSTTGTWASLSLADTGGYSWVVRVMFSNHGNAHSTPTGFTLRKDAYSPNILGGGNCTTWDTNGGVSSDAGGTTTWATDSCYWVTAALEIRQ